MATPDLQQRSLQDLLLEERRLRDLSDRARGDYRQLLQKLARRLLGEAFEAARRENPDITQTWTAADWERFFAQLESFSPTESSTWKRRNGKAHQELEKELTQAQAEINALKVQITALKQKAQEKPFKPQQREQRSKTMPDPKPEQKSETPKKKNRPSQEDKQGNPLVGFVPPQKPLAFEATFREGNWTQLRWRRATMLLYLMATRGFSAHLEFDMLIAPAEGLSYRSNSTRKPLDLLSESGFVVLETLWIKRKDFRFALKTAHLTEGGKELCRMLGWEPVESEWERVKRLHEGERFLEHTLGILYFALHARVRGWEVTVLPKIKGADPDVMVSKSKKKYLVEVELGKKERPAKWKKLADLQGGVAICGLDPENRKRLVGDCKLAKFKVKATDLRTLQDQGEIYNLSQDTPLWVESW